MTDRTANLLITGARLIDPATGTDAIGDLAISNGLVVADAPAGAERIDGRGLVVTPGFCDLHAHLRQPGRDGAETIESGCRAAARGGFTTICAMPNTDPAIDSAGAVSRAVAAGAGGACRVRIIGATSVRRAGREMADLAAMAAAGAVAVSDDGCAVSGAMARETFERVAEAGLLLIEHAEDPSLVAGGVMRAGPTAVRLGLPGWPPAAELTTVERDLALAGTTGARLHLTHLSCASSIEAVRGARARGVAVTCDVTPHHLSMADDWVAGSRRFAWDAEGAPDPALAFDGRCRVNPPLASRADALALLAAVADGTIDSIATDHAPHPVERKLAPFASAAPGLIGLETALSLGLAAVEAGRLALPALVAAMSTRPAAIIGEARSLAVGATADIVAFDPAARWRVDATTLESASSNTPLLGMELPGVVRLTVGDGRITYRS